MRKAASGGGVLLWHLETILPNYFFNLMCLTPNTHLNVQRDFARLTVYRSLIGIPVDIL